MLMSNMWQQMRYEQVETFNEMTKVAEKNWKHGRNSMVDYVINGQNSSCF